VGGVTMAYLNDTQRVEMSIPAHMMLAVLLSGANVADPGPKPDTSSWNAYIQWQNAWQVFNENLKDPEFAKAYEIFKQTKELLLKACESPVIDVYPEKKRISLLRRVERIHSEVMAPYLKKEPDARKLGLIAYYLLNQLVETSYLIIPEESPFGQALETMLPALSPWEGSTPQEIKDYEALNASAEKQSKKILKDLQTAGYYLGI
jgi:hypothetical protein